MSGARPKSQGDKNRPQRSPSNPPRPRNPPPAAPVAQRPVGPSPAPQWLQEQRKGFERLESAGIKPRMSVLQRAEASRAWLEAPLHTGGNAARSSTDPAPEPVAGATAAAAAPEPVAGDFVPWEELAESTREEIAHGHRRIWDFSRISVAAKPAAMDPFSKTFLVEGRPTQFLVITHPDATLEERVPYLAHLCYPLPAVELFGRSAKREPVCKGHHAVMHWWKAPGALELKIT